MFSGEEGEFNLGRVEFEMTDPRSQRQVEELDLTGPRAQVRVGA